jgi:hypothetical protein
MHKTLAEAAAFIDELSPLVSNRLRAVIARPYVVPGIRTGTVAASPARSRP